MNGIKEEIGWIIFEHANDPDAMIEAIYDLINPTTLEKKQEHVEREMREQRDAGMDPDSAVFVQEDLPGPNDEVYGSPSATKNKVEYVTIAGDTIRKDNIIGWEINDYSVKIYTQTTIGNGCITERSYNRERAISDLGLLEEGK